MKTNMHTAGGIALVVTMLLGGVVAVPATAQSEGEQLFQQSCAACHTIGGGRLIGPDLAGVTDRRSEAWLVAFIQSSQEMIRSGDPIATRLYEEYGQMLMPDQPYSAAQVEAILAYINRQSGAAGAAPAAPDTAMAPTGAVAAGDSAEAVRRGRALFVGRVRFADGGPACNACHNVDLVGITTGGALAQDLTTAYSRLSENGLRAIIANPPFPAMATAMGDAPTDEETADLIAFLRAAEREAASQPGRDYARLLLLAGLGGFFVLLLLSAVVWSGRARRAVNHDIYARQTASL